MFPRRYRCALIFSFSFWLCAEAFAETPEETIQKLQDQLNALTRQMQAEKGSPEQEEARYASKITQISPARVVPAPRKEEIIVTRLYDLSDLFAVVPAYPALYESDLERSGRPMFPDPQSNVVGAGGMGGGGGMFNVLGGPSSADPPEHGTLWQMGGTLDGAKTSVKSLISAIQTTVSPDEWNTAGGSSTIAQLGMALLITTNEASHEQITALLGEFRKRWGTLRTVSVHAYWLWLDDSNLTELLTTDQEEKPKGSKPFAHGSVKRDQWNKLLEQIAKEKETDIGYRAAVTCYNGQTVHTLAGRQRMVATGLYPEWLGPEEIHKDQQAIGGVVYSSETKLVQEGVALQVTPLTNTSGKYVVLDIQSRLADLVESDLKSKTVTRNPQRKAVAAVATKKEKPTDDPFGNPVEDNKDKSREENDGPQSEENQNANPSVVATPRPQEVLAALPLPSMNISRLSTTLRVPVKEPYLVGGMSQTGTGARPGKQLYLFVEVFVQELRDDLEPAVKLNAAEPQPADE